MHSIAPLSQIRCRANNSRECRRVEDQAPYTWASHDLKLRERKSLTPPRMTIDWNLLRDCSFLIHNVHIYTIMYILFRLYDLYHACVRACALYVRACVPLVWD